MSVNPDDRDKAISHHLDKIQRMAEERHLLHGTFDDAFWTCSQSCCKSASKYLREQPKYFDCAARKFGTSGGNDPQECDWPFCGCDPAATRVIVSIEESGFTIEKKIAN